MPENIILGEGVFSIGATAIGLTRGGGQFVVEREFKQIEADGDYGPVKGRISKIKSIAKLTMNALEILPANLPAMYAATSLSTATAGHSILTGKDDIEDADYQTTVKWTGKTKGGKAVIITLQNAINLENIDWSLIDKDELVAALTYTAAYDPATRTTEPWSIDIATA